MSSFAFHSESASSTVRTVQSSWDSLAALKAALVAEEEQADVDSCRSSVSSIMPATTSSATSDVSSHRSAALPISILRPSASSLRSSLDSPSSPVHANSRLSGASWGSDAGSLFLSPPRPIRRRSSRVRFTNQTTASPVSMSPTANECRRKSSCNALHDELVLAARMLDVDVSLQAATSTFAHCLPDDFALIPSPPSRLLSPTDKDFAPRPLPYPSLRRQSSHNSPMSSVCDSLSERGSMADADLFNAPNSTSLRDLLRRQSLGSSSRASSYSSVNPTPATSCTSFPSSAPSRRGTTFKDDENRKDAATTGLLSHSITQDAALAYVSLLPSCTPSPKKHEHLPTLNRAGWHEEVGLSPRSGPSPLADDVSQLEDALDVPDIQVDEAQLRISTETEDGDSAKARLRFTSEAPLPKVSPRHTTRHRRSESDVSLGSVMCFPLPPLRSALELDLLPDFSNLASLMDDDEVELLSSTDICLDTPEDDDAPIVGNPEPVPALPASPSLLEVIEENRRNLGWDHVDMDLSPSTSLVEAAASNGIISPNSSLLSCSRSQRSSSGIKPRVLRYGSLESNGDGWSGSESEEEDYVQNIRCLTLRKLGDSSRALGGRSSSSSFAGRQSFSLTRSVGDRTSQLSAASSDSAGPVTPGVHDTFDMSLGAKGGAHTSPFGMTAIVPDKKIGSKTSFDSLVSSRTKSSLPIPTRKVEGWGRPEVLIDEDWDNSGRPWSAGYDSDEEEGDCTIESSRSDTPRGRRDANTAPLGILSKKMGVGLGIDYGSLLDERPPTM